MLIETTIKPRRDGTVSVSAPSRAYTFVQDGHGRMTADVDDSDIGWLLNRDGFLPVNEEDFDKATSLVNAADDSVDDGETPGEVEDLDDDEPASLDVAPIETPTPPKNKGGRPRKAQG